MSHVSQHHLYYMYAKMFFPIRTQVVDVDATRQQHVPQPLTQSGSFTVNE